MGQSLIRIHVEDPKQLITLPPKEHPCLSGRKRTEEKQKLLTSTNASKLDAQLLSSLSIAAQILLITDWFHICA